MGGGYVLLEVILFSSREYYFKSSPAQLLRSITQCLSARGVHSRSLALAKALVSTDTALLPLELTLILFDIDFHVLNLNFKHYNERAVKT